MAGGRQEYCQACRQAQHQAGKARDCTQCDGRCPDLLPENKEAWLLWSLVSTQWRMGMHGPVGLDYSAVSILADIYAIEISPALFKKTKTLEHSALAKLKKEL